MKVALVHDYLKEYGGAERVLEALHEMYPAAPVFTSVYLPQFLGPHKERFGGWEIRESWASRVPFKEKLISVLRVLSPLIFKSFDFSSFDVVIVSATGAYFPNSIQCHPEERSDEGSLEILHFAQNDNRKKPIHICYCHTPPRYLYGYATAREWKKNWLIRVIGEIANHFLRLVDFKAAQKVDYFIANSREVQSRIKKFYRRESVVVYPPVEISSKFKVQSSKLQLKTQNEEYFLAGGRLARPKNVDLIIQACQELKVPLKVFGRGFADYKLKIKNEKLKTTNKNAKIEFVGEVSDEEKYRLMRNARAYIFASEDEDFGITPVEAMSMGTPVIAYRSGGVQESIIDGKTGIFFDKLTVESLTRAIEQLNNGTIKSSDCIKQAQKFSKERFKREIKDLVKSKTEDDLQCL